VEEVGLSQVQHEQVDSIFWHFRADMRSLHEEFDREYSARYREIIDATQEAFRSILNAQQQVAYDSLLAERSQRRGDRNTDSTRAPERGSPSEH
jgi:hypothetical protein